MAGAPAELPALTGIRGVAAWIVVLYHIRLGMAWALPPEAVAALGKGYLAVDLFFMLSGFVLWMNYADSLRWGGIGEHARFIARRIARIWPLHAFMLLGAIALVLATAATGRPASDHYPLAELPLHIALMQNWGFTSGLTWNDPAWSISCEFAAYLIFPLLALSVDWRGFGTPALCALLMLLAFTLFATMWSGGETQLGAQIPRYGLPRALIEFAMGTIVCALWERWRRAPWTSVVALAGLSVALAAWMIGAPETLAVPLIFAGLLLMVALTADSRLNPLGWRPIRFLGEISYSTYLGHFLLFIAFKLIFVTDAAHVPLPLIGLFLVLMLIMSVALHHLVEKPAQRSLNRVFDRVRKTHRVLTPAP